MASTSRVGAVDKRRVILDAAVTVFARQCFHSCRVSYVADEAGVAYGLVYHYFESKEEILNEAVTPLVLRNTTLVEELRESAEPAQQKLRRVIVTLLNSYAEHYPLLFLYL